MYRVLNALNEQVLRKMNRCRLFYKKNERTQKCVRLLQRLLQIFSLMLYKRKILSFTIVFLLKLILKLN